MLRKNYVLEGFALNLAVVRFLCFVSFRVFFFFLGKQGLPTNPTTKGLSNSCLISGFCLHIYSINFYILNFA